MYGRSKTFTGRRSKKCVQPESNRSPRPVRRARSCAELAAKICRKTAEKPHSNCTSARSAICKKTAQRLYRRSADPTLFFRYAPSCCAVAVQMEAANTDNFSQKRLKAAFLHVFRKTVDFGDAKICRKTAQQPGARRTPSAQQLHSNRGATGKVRKLKGNRARAGTCISLSLPLHKYHPAG